MWAERGQRLKPLLSDEAFACGCVQVDSLAPLAPPPQKKNPNMFTKHEQLGLHCIFVLGRGDESVSYYF